MKIPLNKPYISGKEIEYIRSCIDDGFISSNGFFTHKVQEYIENVFDVHKVLLTTSCTDALEMAFILLGIQEGDEIIMPSYTFVSTANAVMLRGAKPVFCDIDYSLNIDAKSINNFITEKTKAILPVHYAGVACYMDNIIDEAKRYGLYIVEDAAQAVNALYKDKYLGTLGDLGCYSFHGTKNISSGEGGAILINKDDDSLLNRANCIWEKGTNRNLFVQGLVDKYTWVEIGSSFAPSEILAAFLYAQLEKLSYITKKREEIYKNYYTNLEPYYKKGLIKLPFIPDYATPNYHIFYILFSQEDHRNIVMQYLRDRGIDAAFHFAPLHLAPMGEKLGYKQGEFPYTEKVAKTILRLPIYPDLTAGEQEYILEHLCSILNIFI